jgi:biotin-dependent carboxylase-like uncharacterized protein
MHTTVQDLGRFGYLRFGVPVSGAMDTFSLDASNSLVGNKFGDACIETTLIGPELLALTKLQIAITGAASSPAINGVDVAMWETLDMEKGDVLSFGKMEAGCRSYIAIRGGVDVPEILGSRSTYTRGVFGGFEGRQLKAGDVVEAFDSSPVKAGFSVPEELRPSFEKPCEAHVVLGPQSDMFTENGLSTFQSGQFRVTSEADRMGYRLEGSRIEHKGKADIVSDAMLPGAIQVPKNGEPIIIMRDAQTTGGYPKIAVVITPDISMISQTRANDTISFSAVSVREARRKTIAYLEMRSKLCASLEAKK